jgi:hypothetical protein
MAIDNAHGGFVSVPGSVWRAECKKRASLFGWAPSPSDGTDLGARAGAVRCDRGSDGGPIIEESKTSGAQMTESLPNL